jgi:hypothetical protein
LQLRIQVEQVCELALVSAGRRLSSCFDAILDRVIRRRG